MGGLVLLCCSDLADNRAAIVDELGQHHGHVVVDGGGVVRPLGRVSHKRPQSKHSRTPHLQRHKHNAFSPMLSCYVKKNWKHNVKGLCLDVISLMSHSSAFFFYCLKSLFGLLLWNQTFARQTDSKMFQCFVKLVDESCRGNYGSIFCIIMKCTGDHHCCVFLWAAFCHCNSLLSLPASLDV